MDLLTVMTEVDTRLKTLPNVNVSLGFTGTINAPAIVQYPPEKINFDLSYSRGADEWTDLLVIVFVGRSSNRAALAEIAPYLRGSGARSIKAKLDSSPIAPYTSCADLQVVSADIDAGAQIGNASYLAAIFHCKITGPGA